ncbi:hypothetical protein [Kitasatospora sp. NPDC059803]|uniref:hypothetical protein n=1 Tax=Kitasatospora sp. NPDC059803 TaxID=3346953 RepID=UPI0036584C9B
MRTVGWQRRRTPPTPRSAPTRAEAERPTAPGVFTRERPWRPAAPFWCTATAYYAFGQPLTLWTASAARDVRTAVRDVRDVIHHMCVLELANLAAQMGPVLPSSTPTAAPSCSKPSGPTTASRPPRRSGAANCPS